MHTRTRSLILLSALSAFSLTLMACPKAGGTRDEAKMPVAVRPQVRRATPQSRFDEGVAAMKLSDWTTARVKFEQALELAGNLEGARYNLALSLQHLGELVQAAELYQEVLTKKPAFLEAALNLAKIRRDQVRYKEGITVLSRLRKTNPYDGRLLNDLAVLYRLNKQYKKAEKALRKLLSRDADNANAHKNLALLHYDQGHYRLAEFMMGTAKRRNEKDPGIYNNLGMIAMKRGDLRAALGNFKKAVELDPSFSAGHLNIGAVALSYRDYAAAIASFSLAVNLDAASWEAHHYYAQALEGGQDLDGAAREYAAVKKIRPDFPPAAYGLCKALQNSRPEAAETECLRFMRMKGARQADVENAKQRLESIKMMREIKAEEAASPPALAEPAPGDEGTAAPAPETKEEAPAAEDEMDAPQGTPEPDGDAAGKGAGAEVGDAAPSP